jgi:hypothetical protein
MEIGVRQHLVYDESTQDSWINTELEYEDIEKMFVTPMLQDSLEKRVKEISLATFPNAERAPSDFTFYNLKRNLLHLLQCVSKKCTGSDGLKLDLSIHSHACLPGTGGTRPKSMGWPIATDFIFIETVDVLKNNFGSLPKLELTVSADDCLIVLFGCTDFTKMFVKGMDPNVFKANWEKVKKDFPRLQRHCGFGPNGCSNMTKLIVKSVKLHNLKWNLVKSSVHFKKLETLVLYLDDVADIGQIDRYVTKIFRRDKDLILDLFSSTRVMLVLKQAGNTWFELCRDPVNFGLIQVIEKSPPLNQHL